MGLRNNPTPWNFSKVDTNKFKPRSNWGIPQHQVALNQAFEFHLGNLHYANPELRTAWRSNPVSMANATTLPDDSIQLEPTGHTANAPFPEGGTHFLFAATTCSTASRKIDSGIGGIPRRSAPDWNLRAF